MDSQSPTQVSPVLREKLELVHQKIDAFGQALNAHIDGLHYTPNVEQLGRMIDLSLASIHQGITRSSRGLEFDAIFGFVMRWFTVVCHPVLRGLDFILKFLSVTIVMCLMVSTTVCMAVMCVSLVVYLKSQPPHVVAQLTTEALRFLLRPSSAGNSTAPDL